MTTAAATRSTRRLVLGIALFVVLGTPLVAYIWETLNRVLSGVLEPLRLVLTVPAALLFYIVLRAMGRVVEAWHGERHGSSDGA